MVDCKPAGTPVGPSVELGSDSPLLGRAERKLFRRLIGRLIFLVIATRPDIAFAVNQLSQYLAEPRKAHFAATKHVPRYIKGTMRYGLTSGAKGRQPTGLYAYANSAYSNSAKNRSITGFIFARNCRPRLPEIQSSTRELPWQFINRLSPTSGYQFLQLMQDREGRLWWFMVSR